MLPLLLALLLAQPPAPELAVDPADLGRFPPPEVCQASLRAAEDHVAWLDGQLGLWPEHWRQDPVTEARAGYLGLREWRDEAARHRDAWGCLVSAQGGDDHDYCGADWFLEQLRDQIGPEDYLAGRMPPPVPLARFGRLH